MICLLFFFIITLVNCDRVVETNDGPVRGKSLDTKDVEAFLGIPYAEPPVGNLRFAKPVPKSPWKETYDANELPPFCVQTVLKEFTEFLGNFTMNEDCLYLNLWVPKTQSTLKPIMVFIHGGGYMTGSSSLRFYDGAALSRHGDVIVASMNYRVGTLGFFSAFIDEAPGSIGMYDQLLAIRWIKDNAKHFGGDPDNIVLFGESAGGFSVGLHMISPLSKNLFKRAILQSGAGISPMYSNNNELLSMGSTMSSKLLGCASNDEELKENPKAVVECMKNLPPEKFTEADSVLFQKFILLVPRVGDEFLPENPADLCRKGEFKDTEVLLGVIRDEGSMFASVMMNQAQWFGDTEKPTLNETSAKEIVYSFMKIDDKADSEKNIIQSYFKKVKDESRYTYIDAVSDIIGDSLITCGTVFQADFQSLKHHPVYFYVFDYRSSNSRFAKWMGVPHFAELQYVFGVPSFDPFTEQDEELSFDMMSMWTSFARKGDPTISGGLKWPKYTFEDPKYLVISQRDRVGVKPDNYRCEMWRELYRSTIDEEVIQKLKTCNC